MENEFGWDNKKLGKIAANFCYLPGAGNDAVAWVLEALVLPIGCKNGYTEKGLAHLIKVRLDEIDEVS